MRSHRAHHFFRRESGLIYQTGLEAQIYNLMSLVQGRQSNRERICTATALSQGYAAFIQARQQRTTQAMPLRPNVVCEYKEAMQFCAHLQRDALSLLDDKRQNEVVTVKEDADAEKKADLIQRAIHCLDTLSRPH